jgi:hypothetical protein
VTGVALISFITLALTGNVAKNYEELQVKLIVWIFAMRFLMDFMSGCSYFINEAISKAKYCGPEDVRLRAAADPPDLDRRDPLHLDVLRDELAPDRRHVGDEGPAAR